MTEPVEQSGIASHPVPETNRPDGLTAIEAKARRIFWQGWLALWVIVVAWAIDRAPQAALVVAVVALFWPLVVPVWLVGRRVCLRKNQRINSLLPGAVPFGIPPAGLQGFDGLERNQYGALDMTKYSPEQWLATRLAWCREHMSGPQDARFRVVTDQFGNKFAADPCGCGQIVNLERLARAAQVDLQSTPVAVAGSAGAAIVSDLTHHKTAQDFAMGYGVGAVVENAFKQRRYRRLYQLLSAHPELDGIWIPRQKFRLAQQPLPLHPPRYPRPTGFTPNGFWMPESPLADGNRGAASL